MTASTYGVNGTSETNVLNGADGHSPEKIVQTLNGISADTFDNDGERIQTLLAAYSLVSRLETPWDFVLRLCMGQVPS